MDDENKFVSLAGLICEPSRARILWNLLDGKAYTASELSCFADISPTSASNHLSKLLEAELVKVESQGRYRYYSLYNSETAYAVEALATLTKGSSAGNKQSDPSKSSIRYCRTCYDHLAGFVGVRITEVLETRGYLIKSHKEYIISEEGWNWLLTFSISKESFQTSRRAMARQCLDWSERRPHLAGHLGAMLLEKMLEGKWFKKNMFSRELYVTPRGRQELHTQLGLALP